MFVLRMNSDDMRRSDVGEGSAITRKPSPAFWLERETRPVLAVATVRTSTTYRDDDLMEFSAYSDSW